MKFIFVLVFLFLNGCTTASYTDYLRMYNINPPTMEEFTHCYDYGCKTKVSLALPKNTKRQLEKIFTPTPKNAEEERQKISNAIKVFENNIGNITGTKNDKRGTFRLYQDNAKSTKKFQQDCVDESTNTTIYIALLQQLNLLAFHTPSFPTSRQPFIGGAPWWHQTAVIQEIETSEKFAVDSWFRDNGYPAFIVPYQEWINGWLPPKPKASKGLTDKSD